MFCKHNLCIFLLRLLGGLLLDLIPFPFLMAAISFPLALIVAAINFVTSFTLLLALVHSFIILPFFPPKTIFETKAKVKSSLQLRAKMLAQKPHIFDAAEASMGTFNPNF